MCNRFEADRAAIARVYHCPYHPLHGIGEYRREHQWRKPNPGMNLQAIFDFRLDPARCAIVGDKMSDIEAGGAAGLGLRILVASGPCQNGGGDSHPMKWSPISAKRSHCSGPALRQPRPNSAPGILEAPAIQRLNLAFPSAVNIAEIGSTPAASDLETSSPSRGDGAEKNVAIFAAKVLVTGTRFWYLSRQIDLVH
jgi:HAD-hyrolase-like